MGPQRVLADLSCLEKNWVRLSYAMSWSCTGSGGSDPHALSFRHNLSIHSHRGGQRSLSEEDGPQRVWSRWLTSQAVQRSKFARSHEPISVRCLPCPSACVRSPSDETRAYLFDHRCWHTSGKNFDGEEKISVTFVCKDGEEEKIQVPVGMSMLEAAHENDIELEGACEGSLACSTCHVIVMEEEMYNRIPEPSDEENDMLDLAFGLTETSRLGCQVIAKPELDGLQLALPAATRNFAVDGHVPKPH